jgi:hypothetical protein
MILISAIVFLKINRGLLARTSGGVGRDGIVFGRVGDVPKRRLSALLLDAREGFNSVLLSSEVRLHWYLMICAPFESTPRKVTFSSLRLELEQRYHLNFLPCIFRCIYAFFVLFCSHLINF